MNRKWLQSALSTYSTTHQEEMKFKSRFIDLLFYDNCFDRALLTGHITASAWVLTPDHQRVALLHHKKLDRWLQPGGHADGDENVQRVAQKELEEEMGLTDISPIGHSFFDLDIHTIPERKDVPEHEHFDIRFAWEANDPSQLIKNDESNEVAWVELDEMEALVGEERSLLRMKEKTLLFSNANH